MSAEFLYGMWLGVACGIVFACLVFLAILRITRPRKVPIVTPPEPEKTERPRTVLDPTVYDAGKVESTPVPPSIARLLERRL